MDTGDALVVSVDEQGVPTEVVFGGALCHADRTGNDSDGYGYDIDGVTPDLDDPATLGCLLALVREAWGPTCSVIHVLDGNGWALCTSGGCLGLPDLRAGTGTRFHPDYAEALVAALEAAPS
jgi:hypothetical protein